MFLRLSGGYSFDSEYVMTSSIEVINEILPNEKNIEGDVNSSSTKLRLGLLELALHAVALFFLI